MNTLASRVQPHDTSTQHFNLKKKKKLVTTSKGPLCMGLSSVPDHMPGAVSGAPVTGSNRSGAASGAPVTGLNRSGGGGKGGEGSGCAGI